MESLRRLTSSIFDSDARGGRRASIQNGLLSPISEAAAVAAQRSAPNDLDITFITERLVVMGFPSHGPTDKKRNQNNIDDLAEYLEMYHSNHYLIFNLNALDEDVFAQVQNIESLVSAPSPVKPMPRASTGSLVEDDREKATSSIADKVKLQMVEFSWERDGMKAHTPPFDLIFRICYAIFAWLSLDASNIVLINCQTGKTRSSIVVACYLLYARLANDPTDAFVEFYRKRWGMASLTPDALRLKTPPSIQRFLAEFHDIVDNQRIPNDRPLRLKGVIIRAVPVEVQPCVQIWDDYRIIYCTADPNEVGSDTPVVDWNGEDGCLAVLWENGLDLDGGFSILCSFGEEGEDESSNLDASSKVLFRYADSTWFLTPGLITLPKGKLDMMKQYESAFNEEEFSMDLVFVESKQVPRKHVPIDFTGNAAVKQGIVEITKHHLVLPDPGMHSNFIKMGFSDAATTFALQRSQNAPNIALDLLHSSVLGVCFPQSKVREQQTSRRMLPSYSSASLLGGDRSQRDHVLPAAAPAARRQSTAEIAALQSQLSTSSAQKTVVMTSQCSVCNDDDYMKRPQIVRCTGMCGGFYHTTCVGLKRIPFGLTTLSDRTNHAVYVKKYFSAWECDKCTADRPPATAPSAPTATTCVTTVHERRVSFETATKTGQPTAVTSKEDEKLDKLKEFLAKSGVSVEDLLRAATTPNVAISPTTAANQSVQLTSPPPDNFARDVRGNIEESPTKQTPIKHGNPQEDPSSKVSAIKSPPPATNNVQTLGEKKEATTSQDDPRKALLSQLMMKRAPPPTEATQHTEASTPKPDPKTALFTQIAARHPKDDYQMQQETSPSQSVAPASDVTRKYERMLQRGVPFEAVQNCMQKDGIDPSSLKPIQQPAIQPTNDQESAEVGTKLKDMDTFRAYFSMLRMGCPREAVHHKILMDGADPILLELGPDAIFEKVKDRIKMETSSTSSLQDDIKSVKTCSKPDRPVTEKPAPTPVDTMEKKSSVSADILLKDHEQYSKYFKMLKMGLPQDAVRHKMEQDGADLRALELGGEAPLSKLTEKSVEVRLGDDPQYSKYFKMLKMGLPLDAVRHKMQSEQADVRALELGADAFVSQLTVSAEDAAKKTAPPPVKPKPRRKKLHWQPIAEDRLTCMNRQTIWEDKDDDVMSFDMDMAELESLFFASSNEAAKKKKTGTSKELKRKQAVTLIDGKRAMNAAISLARIKLSYVEIAQAIERFDPSGLTAAQLKGIRECLPTPEEVVAVSAYTGDTSMLGEAEKFILEISKVKRFVKRAECLVFKVAFAPRREELRQSVTHVIDACQQVKDSRLLKILLSMVLKLGNTLNGSGEENEIRGFAVDSLLRLGHTKAVNQKTTVLHYLVRLVKKNHPAVLEFQRELASVPLAARQSFESVDEDFGQLQAGLTQLSEEFQDLQKLQCEESDEPVVVATVSALQQSVDEIGSQMEEMEKTIERARDQVQSVLEYFGEDPKKNATEFFTTLASFCTLFDTARQEVDKADEEALRAERLKIRRNASARPSVTSAGAMRREQDRALSDRGFLSSKNDAPQSTQ